MKKSLFKSRLLWGLIFVAFVLSSAIADEKTDKVDKLFAKWDSTISPGAALAIIKDGEIIYKRGYGMANLEHSVPITSTSVFRIGSTSKQFTASCIAILALEGKISLDDDIRKYIPEIPKYQKPITVRNLVHHTSGLRDYTGLLPLAGYRTDADSPTIVETIEMLARQKSLNFTPGEMYSYSNSGYFLMSIIVERVSGKSLNDFAREHIFEPLGMKNTHFHDDFQMIVKNRADGYSPRKNGFRIHMTNWDHVGDGGIYTTVEDLYLWDQAFYNNKLGKEFIELIQTPGVLNNGEKLDYAFGLRKSNYKGLKTVGHSGGWVAFSSHMVRYPEQKFTVVCLANSGTLSPGSLCRKIADIYLADQFKEEPAEKPKKEKKITPIALPREDLEEKAGNYHDEKSGMWITVSVEDNKLNIIVRSRKYLLSPVSKTRFQTLDAPFAVSLDFSPAVKGRARKVKLTMRGREGISLQKAPKMVPLTPVKLREYAGKYYSDELDTTYKLGVEKDALVFKHRNARPRSPLQAMASDEFVWGRGNINFVRNKKKKIIGFKFVSGRATFEFIKRK